MSLTFGSLFAGIGGFDLGFERAGMECRWQVEINEYATRVLAKHWPSVHRERDILQCGRHNLEQVDVICGGFPCQDISYAGLGAGLDGERSGLFFEAIRVVHELRPRIVVMENVAALLTRGLDRVLGTLAEIGFDAEWHCIPAAAVGAPHIRDRVFVLAYSAGVNGRKLHSGRHCFGKRESCQEDGAGFCDDSGQRGEDVANSDKSRSQGRSYIGCNAREELKTFERSNRERGGCWFSESRIRRVSNGIPNRVDRLRGLGNAVVPQVAEWIGRQIMLDTKRTFANGK